MMTEPVNAVIAPDVLGKSFHDSACWAVMEAWRDSKFTAHVDDRLLKQYLRLLQRLGLTKDLLRNWASWLTSAPNVLYRTGAGLASETAELMTNAESLTQSKQMVVVTTQSTEHGCNTMKPDEFITLVEATQ